MKSTTESSPLRQGRATAWAAAHTGVAAGAVDLLINLHHSPAGLEWPAYALLPMLASAAIGFLSFLAAAGALRVLLGRDLTASSGGALGLGLAAILLMTGIQWCEATPYYYSRLLSFLFMGNLGVAVTAHVIWKTHDSPARRERIALLTLAAFAYGAAAAHLAGTLYITRVEEIWDYDTAVRFERAMNFVGGGIFGLALCGVTTVLGERVEALAWGNRIAPRLCLPLPWAALAFGLVQWWRLFGGARGYPDDIAALLFMAMGLSALVTLILLIRPRGLALWLPAALLALLVTVGGVAINRQVLADKMGFGSYAAEDRDVRHIILVTSDALRSDVLEPYGGKEIETPGLNAFAAESVVFDEAISAASWTLPAFAGMFSGLAPGVFDSIGVFWSMPNEVATLAERLADDGYDTAAIGMNPLLRPRHGLDQGFRHYDFYPRPRKPRTLGSRAISAQWPSLYQTDRTSEELKDLTVDWIERHRDRDFFLWLHFWDPHTPLGPPPPFRPDGEGPRSIREPWERSMEIKDGSYDPQPDEREWLRQLYLGEVRYVDAMFGQLMEKLKELGLYDEALIVFSSDHGEEFWDHGTFGHGQSLFHELIQVPLFIKPPGNPAPSRRDQPVWTVSLMPTLLDFAGIGYDAGEFSAPSLLPLLNASEEPLATLPIYSETAPEVEARHRWGVRFDTFEYMQGAEGKPDDELYDLENDPAQIDDLSERAPEVTAQGDEFLQDYRQENETLRDRHGLVLKERLELPEEEMDRLRKLGYI